MRKLIITGSLLLLLPALLAAQVTPKWELGTKLGVSFISNTGDIISFGVPGGGPFSLTAIAGSPTIHFGFFPHPNVVVRPELGLSVVNVSNGADETLTNLVATLQGEYHFTGVTENSAYVAAGLGAFVVDVDVESENDFSAHGAIGYRFLPYEFLAFAVEGRYRRWFDFEINEFGVALTMAAVVN